jgi:hypothetical protein
MDRGPERMERRTMIRNSRLLVFELDLKGQLGLKMQRFAELHKFSLFMRWGQNTGRRTRQGKEIEFEVFKAGGGRMSQDKGALHS